MLMNRNKLAKRAVISVVLFKMTLLGFYSGYLQYKQRQKELYLKYKAQVNQFEIWQKKKAIQQFSQLKENLSPS
jgi:steroid 5-alpha reductase family enzyme